MAKRGHKMCLGITALILIIFITVIVTLIFTVFKIKNPEISIHPFGLQNFTFSPNISVNVSLGTVITIVNPNYGSFEFQNTSGYINFDANVVAEIPLGTHLVPARSTINVVTAAEFMVLNLIRDRKFWVDVLSGTLNLTSWASMPGKVRVLKVIKLRATVYSTCDIHFNIISKHMDSNCVSKIKL